MIWRDFFSVQVGGVADRGETIDKIHQACRMGEIAVSSWISGEQFFRDKDLIEEFPPSVMDAEITLLFRDTFGEIEQVRDLLRVYPARMDIRWDKKTAPGIFRGLLRLVEKPEIRFTVNR